MFKLRAGYGEIGNENPVADYAYQATLMRNNMTYSFGNQPVTGSAVSTFVNENIAWEKKKTMNVGIDIALFNNRIEFTAEWFKNQSVDLLYGVPVPENAGVSNTSVTMNAASMDNTGLEFSLTYRNNDHALKHQISANVSTVKNKVKSLGFGTDYYLTGDYMTYVGEEVGQFYGYVYEGIARTQEELDAHNAVAMQQGAQVGDCLYKDLNGDMKITADDRQVLGSGLPKLNFGLSAHLEYKIFDLSIATYGALGFHVADHLYNALNSTSRPKCSTPTAGTALLISLTCHAPISQPAVRLGTTSSAIARSRTPHIGRLPTWSWAATCPTSGSATMSPAYASMSLARTFSQSLATRATMLTSLPAHGLRASTSAPIPAHAPSWLVLTSHSNQKERYKYETT